MARALSKEQKKAYSHFINCFSCLPFPTAQLNSRLWITDELTSSRSQNLGRLLPSDRGWIWKQSSVVGTSFCQKINQEIKIRKLTPRKTAASDLAIVPSYKLWEFTFKSKTVYWCEKGTDLGTREPKVEDYYFLAKFMTAEVAASIWPCYTH